MTINFTELPLMQRIMSSILIVQVTVSFTVFGFLQSFSYLALGLTLLNFLIMGCLYIVRKEMSVFGLLSFIFFILLISFSFINNTDYKNAIYRSAEIFLLLMLTNYFKNDLSIFLKTTALTFSLCVYANIGLMLMFPDWMFAAEDAFDSYILGGNYNQMGCRLLCAIVSNFLCIRFGKRWLFNTILVTILSIITLAIVGSTTALSCIGLLTIFCLVPSVKLQKIGVISFFIFYILFQCFVCFPGEGLHNNEIASYIIKDVMGKDLTFTNRTRMWSSAGELFAQSPIIGYGIVDNEWYVSNMDSFAKGPHNFIYGILINGGLVLMFLFIALFIYAVKHLMRYTDKTSVTLMMGITTLLFMMTMEVYPYFFIFYLLTLAYYYPELDNIWQSKKIEKENQKDNNLATI